MLIKYFNCRAHAKFVKFARIRRHRNLDRGSGSQEFTNPKE